MFSAPGRTNLPVPCPLQSLPWFTQANTDFSTPCSSPPQTLKLVSLTSTWSPPCMLCFSALMASRPQTRSSRPASTHQPGLGAAWRDTEFAGSSRQSCRQLEAEHCMSWKLPCHSSCLCCATCKQGVKHTCELHAMQSCRHS